MIIFGETANLTISEYFPLNHIDMTVFFRFMVNVTKTNCDIGKINRFAVRHIFVIQDDRCE